MADRVLTSAGWLGAVLAALALGRFAAIDPRWDAALVWIVVGGIAAVAVYVAAVRRVASSPAALASGRSQRCV